MNKNKIKSWLETIDILSSPEEMKSIRAGKKEKKLISHTDILKKLD